MNFFRFSLVLLFVLVNALWASTLSVRLTTERHRTEWNWVEYRLKLKNLSNKPLKNPVVRYFAENPRIQYCEAHPNDTGCAGMEYGAYDVDSTLRAVVDYFSVVNTVKPKYDYDSKHTVITFKFQGSIPAGATSKAHLRIMRKNYPAWDCSRDYSFQKNALVREENYKMAVYDADGNILWGNDPVSLKHDTAHVYWHDRSSISVISPYEAKDSSKTLSGRFWLLKDKPLTLKEKHLLDSLGVKHLETTRYQNKGLHLMKAVESIAKKSLDKAISSFYNAFAVNDTTPFSIKLSPGDLYEETRTCNADDSCTTVVNERSWFDMNIECWPDLTMGMCKTVVLSCGGDSAFIDRNLILAKIRKDSVQCLEKHKDVKMALVRRELILDTYEGRTSVKVEHLQHITDGWPQALQEKPMTSNWLKKVSYTGEGIVVDVHDKPIDYTHPGLNEPDANGEDHPRKAIGNDDSRSITDEKGIINGHGTHVAGIIGGNGRMSETFEGAEEYQYRGVAPKVKFYSSNFTYEMQRGHVVNLSGGLPEDDIGTKEHPIYLFYYGNNSAWLDKTLFHDSKLPSEWGDNLTKSFVKSAGNNADESPQLVWFSTTESDWMCIARGYHSISGESKNPIVVGSYNQSDDILSVFSSLGPTWDGRIKPDVMAPGDGPKYKRVNLEGTPSRTPIYKGATVGEGDKEWRSGIVSAVPFENENGSWYGPKAGTSQAAPFVTGVIALMYQKFKEKTGLSLDDYSMRNSTTKALLIHTAIDMKGRTVSEKLEDDELEIVNPDINNLTPYGSGPDFATGWGRVDAEAALGMIENFDAGSRTFDRFREFSIYEGTQKRWTLNVPEGEPHLRVTLAWDDAPGDPNSPNYMKPKLVNDLDVYLIDPYGYVWYPWILDPLPTKNVDEYGAISEDDYIDIKKRKWGKEKISVKDAVNSKARRNDYEDCPISKSPIDKCFDRRNNVEVVDFFHADPGEWQVVVKGYRVEQGNSPDGGAQIASIVSTFPLNEPTGNKDHPYPANTQISELRDLAEGCQLDNCYLEYYVTFGQETSLGEGDHIYLYDVWDRLIGDYTGNSLANQRIRVSTRYLKIVLDSDNDDSQGYGYSISKIERVPYGVLQVLFPPYKKGE